jgi:hypothetical protein
LLFAMGCSLIGSQVRTGSTEKCTPTKYPVVDTIVGGAAAIFGAALLIDGYRGTQTGDAAIGYGLEEDAGGVSMLAGLPFLVTAAIGYSRGSCPQN